MEMSFSDLTLEKNIYFNIGEKEKSSFVYAFPRITDDIAFSASSSIPLAISKLESKFFHIQGEIEIHHNIKTPGSSDQL
jgi:hypothetical protein